MFIIGTFVRLNTAYFILISLSLLQILLIPRSVAIFTYKKIFVKISTLISPHSTASEASIFPLKLNYANITFQKLIILPDYYYYSHISAYLERTHI